MAAQELTGGIHGRGPVVLVVTIVMIVLATVFVLLRMVSRIGIVRRVTLDDYFIVLAWVIAFGLSFAICYGTGVGLGRHQEDIPSQSKPALKKAAYIFSVLYNPALMATKTSILLFYLTLSKTQKVFKWATVATLAVVNLAGIALTFLNIFQCSPIGAAFKTPVPDSARCEDIVTLYLSSAPVNIITDLAILFLPMPTLTSMRLPKKQKTILVITFGFGFFVAVVDVIRIAYLQEASLNRLADVQNQTANAGNAQRNNTDVPWYASLSFMWSAIEVNVGIMCACVPALKPLVSRFLPNMLRDATRNGSALSASHIPSLTSIDAGHLRSRRTQTATRTDVGERSLSPVEKVGSDGAMDMMDFLTTPDMVEMPTDNDRPPTAATSCGRAERTGNPSGADFFDFVNMEGRKPMILLTTRESLFPVTMVTVLFFLWGVAYGFLDTLNAQFQKSAKMTPGQTIAIHSAYFAGYAVAALTFGRLVLKHWGFKACFIVGLCIYGCGTLIFWPSAVLTSFPAFMVSNLVVGMGLATLEIAANPFSALCGPPEYMEVRLNLSQGVQAIGSVGSPLLAAKVLFKSTDANSLLQTQWTYLGIALFVIVLAVAYYYVPLPEASDDDLADIAARSDFANNTRIRGIRVIWITAALGVLSEFCYVGSQEAVSTSFTAFLTADVNSHLNTNNYLAIAHTCFAVSRFLGAVVNIWVKPRLLLLTFYAGIIALSICAMNLTGTRLVVVIMLLFFCEGPVFSLIYAMCLRGMGRATKDTSALLTASISGGAIIPVIQHAVSGGNTARYSYSYCVIVAIFVFGSLLAIYCNLIAAARKQVDPVKREQGLVQRSQSVQEERKEESLSSRGSKLRDKIQAGKKHDSKARDERTVARVGKKNEEDAGG